MTQLSAEVPVMSMADPVAPCWARVNPSIQIRPTFPVMHAEVLVLVRVGYPEVPLNLIYPLVVSPPVLQVIRGPAAEAGELLMFTTSPARRKDSSPVRP